MSAVVRGGTKPNVIAEEAYAEVDMRVPTIADADETSSKILDLKPATEGVSIKVIGELNRPALREKQCQCRAVCTREVAGRRNRLRSDRHEHRRRIRRQLYPAPFTATLDGLGVDGKGAHTDYEQMYVSSIVPRTRLLYRLFQTLK